MRLPAAPQAGDTLHTAAHSARQAMDAATSHGHDAAAHVAEAAEDARRRAEAAAEHMQQGVMSAAEGKAWDVTTWRGPRLKGWKRLWGMHDNHAVHK